MKTQFKWITQELGPARELDVFIKRVVRPVTDGKPNGPGAAVLAKDLQRKDARRPFPALARPSNPDAFVILFSILLAGSRPESGRATPTISPRMVKKLKLSKRR